MTSYTLTNIYNVVYDLPLLETDVNNYKTHFKKSLHKIVQYISCSGNDMGSIRLANIKTFFLLQDYPLPRKITLEN